MSVLLVRIFVRCVLFLTLTTNGARALETIQDGPTERRRFGDSVRRLLRAEEFGKLDALADTVWHTQARFSDGTWKLAVFYDALGVSSTQRDATDWPACFARFERWKTKAPTSASARIGHAITLTSYAWDARGSGYADTVTAEGWRLFAARLREARTVLDADPVTKQRPGYHAAMMTIALGQEWPRSAYDALFAAAVKLAPDYETFYFRRASFLQLKWHGTSPDEWHRFAQESATTTQERIGQALYARIVWATVGVTARNLARFRAERIDWPRMRAGFEDLAQQHPDSLWNANAFCFYAWAAQDRATAKRLFDELKGRYAPTIWGDAATFERAQTWARSAPATTPASASKPASSASAPALVPALTSAPAPAPPAP